MTAYINSTAVVYGDGTYNTTANSVTGVLNLANTAANQVEVAITTVGVTWQVNTAYFETRYAWGGSRSQDGIYVKEDGTKVWILEGRSSTSRQIHEWTLSTPYLITSVSSVIDTSLPLDVSQPTGITFKPDGTKCYYCATTGSVYQANLSTAWTWSTRSYATSFSCTSEDSPIYGVEFNPAGTKMYVIGGNTDRVFEYNLSTAWLVSSASAVSGGNTYIGSQITDAWALRFNSDGTKMYAGGRGGTVGYGNTIIEYNLSTPYSVNTASYSGSWLFVNSDCTGIDFAANGTKLYVSSDATGLNGDTANQWDLSSGIRLKSFKAVGITFTSNATHLIIGN